MLTPLILTSLFGCGEPELIGAVPSVEPGIPNITVLPPTLSWGQLTSADEVIQTFTVSNHGQTALTVSGISFQGSNAYSLPVPGGFIVEAGESMPVQVAFTPTDVVNDAVALITSDDPDEPVTQVLLAGEGSLTELTITPPMYDFGPVGVPCSEDVTLTLQNTGAENLVVSDINEVGAGFQITDSEALPLLLAPGETSTVDVVFMPSAEGTVTGSLDVVSNDPRGIVSATQTGSGYFGGEQRDAVIVPVNPAVDVLFAVDQSCSMDDYNAPLGANFNAFINAIDSVTDNWHIGVADVTTGCFNDGVLDRFTPNYETLFAESVLEGDDPGGLATLSETLFQLADNALAQTQPGQCNAGFLRPNASLHVIMVSDEPDRSPGTWSNYLTTYQSHLATPELLTVSAVVDSTTCEWGPGTYPDAVAATNGVLLDICGGWQFQLDQLGTASIQDVYAVPLTAPPVESTLIVSLNGSPVTAGWSFDPVDRQVVFTVPLEEGTTVEVEYDAVVQCD